MYVAALRSMIKCKSQEASSTTRDLEVKPSDLIDFMIWRAKAEPLAFCVLIELRFAEIIFLLHQAEKQSRNDLFLAGIKFLLPLYASSHAIKYVSMLSDFLVDWHCMSEAEKIIFAKGVITRKTKNGKNIFTDRFVEWMMKDMRMWLGKHSSLHHHKLVEQVAITLNERKKQKQEGSQNRKPGDRINPIKEIEINKVFCESLLFAHEYNLWGPGDIIFDEKKNQTAKENDNRRPMQRPFKSTKGVPLNKDLLFCISTGSRRLSKYFQTFLVDGKWEDSKRSEKESEGGVLLKKINTTLADDEEGFNIEMERITFLNDLDIKSAYTVKELKEELKFLNNELEKLGKEKVTKDPRKHPGQWNKNSYACCIATARLSLLDADKDFSEKRRTEIWEKHDMRRMSKEREFCKKVNAELNNPFFSFKGIKQYEDMKADNGNDQAFSVFKFRSSAASPTNENENENVGNNDGIVLSDSDCDEDSSNKARESIGGTHLFAGMTGLF